MGKNYSSINRPLWGTIHRRRRAPGDLAGSDACATECCCKAPLTSGAFCIGFTEWEKSKGLVGSTGTCRQGNHCARAGEVSGSEGVLREACLAEVK